MNRKNIGTLTSQPSSAYIRAHLISIAQDLPHPSYAQDTLADALDVKRYLLSLQAPFQNFVRPRG
jgi:hypothetical protein